MYEISKARMEEIEAEERAREAIREKIEKEKKLRELSREVDDIRKREEKERSEQEQKALATPYAESGSETDIKVQYSVFSSICSFIEKAKKEGVSEYYNSYYCKEFAGGWTTPFNNYQRELLEKHGISVKDKDSWRHVIYIESGERMRELIKNESFYIERLKESEQNFKKWQRELEQYRKQFEEECKESFRHQYPEAYKDYDDDGYGPNDYIWIINQNM